LTASFTFSTVDFSSLDFSSLSSSLELSFFLVFLAFAFLTGFFTSLDSSSLDDETFEMSLLFTLSFKDNSLLSGYSR